MKTKSLTLFFLAFLLSCTQVVQAGNQTGRIYSLNFRSSDGLVYFVMDGASIEKPSCAKASYWIVKDENSPTGKRIIAMLLAAKLANAAIVVKGSNLCDRWADGESVEEIVIS
ncbi:MAG: hypothetical protein IV107_18940 [Paucibacter sp.]|nr:hypothetical protein [Roseateles sp.]